MTPKEFLEKRAAERSARERKRDLTKLSRVIRAVKNIKDKGLRAKLEKLTDQIKLN